MSVYGAMNTAVSGLGAQSSALANISDNIANSRTTGYKRVDTAFSTLVTSSDQNQHQAGGVRARPSFRNDVQGNMEQSQVNTHLGVTGKGYFSVSQPESLDPDSGAVNFKPSSFYTRAGDFEMDQNGYLVNSSGYYLNGWDVNPENGVADTAAVKPIRVSQLQDSPVATTNIQYAANLPSQVDINTELPANSIQIYDSVGNERNLDLNWEKTANDQWTLNIAPAGDVSHDQFGPIVFNFDKGRIDSINASGADGSGPNNGQVGLVPPSGNGEPAELAFSLDFGGGVGDQDVVLNMGTYGEANGTTQFTGTELQLNSLDQNGVPPGAFKDLIVDDAGYVNLNYDNGQTKTYFQVPLTQFNNPNGLTRLDGNAFQQSPNSGVPRLNPPGLGSNGTISSQTLEASNVDISDEFTKMITAQRTYSANSKVITTADEMLAEVINIKR
ncbi:flagellar hook protein FlgE [Fodinicurvata fenggangensis]|uniref:flagellar hook protein FlgE n=1 Tax=Fodinicurvata fenggangensis TaxID=1121830 RepID=UPI0009E0917A|nr:flagellar hook protein FlgE [Fodinicurvata fenggangensis]